MKMPHMCAAYLLFSFHIITPSNYTTFKGLSQIWHTMRITLLHKKSSTDQISIGDLYYLVTVILTLSLIPVYSSVTVIVTVPAPEKN